MLIAIDETGDFAPDSELFSFFVAVIIDQSNDGLAIKEKQFQEWLKSIPQEKFSDRGEVKGSDLSDDELLSFVEQVYNEAKPLLHAAVCFKPIQNPLPIMLKFKEHEVARMETNIQLAENDGKHEMAEQYRRMSIWYKNAKKMHYQHYFKMLLLNKIIVRAFDKAIGVSIIYEMLHDKARFNLLNIEFKIDQDFIRGADPNIYWKEVLRNTFIRETNKKGVPTLNTWPETHPFLQKYRHNTKEGLDFKDLFSKHCDFLVSHDHFEIQIADIVGIIYNRCHNRARCSAAYNALFAKKQKEEKPLCIVLNQEAV